MSAEFRYNRPAPAPTGDLRQKINDQQQLTDLINDHFPAPRIQADPPMSQEIWDNENGVLMLMALVQQQKAAE
ncbi:hypothetical protein BofuT4_uP022400.1 [Botrytis cinerea T4]|uniref:Uncharacterized protein n=1 Tax=Botryotinia fuckeliana (strain T4) TaxID=999810 RepID=G2YGT8_BOTF4|nr:hypothetical protein BofuT4_uP022400.1 [Botrytis cinerea T4]